MKWYTILKASLVGPHHRTYFSEEEATTAPVAEGSLPSSSSTTSSSTSSSSSTSLAPTTPTTRTRGVVEKKRLPTFISYPELTIPALGGSAPFKWPSPYPSEEVECPLCGAADHAKIDFFISEKDEGG
jgi:hypothetical protein